LLLFPTTSASRASSDDGEGLVEGVESPGAIAEELMGVAGRPRSMPNRQQVTSDAAKVGLFVAPRTPRVPVALLYLGAEVHLDLDAGVRRTEESK
jgi:hypothetical protein